MPNGNYDRETGICVEDEPLPAGLGESSSDLPEHCMNPLGGYDPDCLSGDALAEALKRLWEWMFGSE